MLYIWIQLKERQTTKVKNNRGILTLCRAKLVVGLHYPLELEKIILFRYSQINSSNIMLHL
jgi:hypothetical protein